MATGSTVCNQQLLNNRAVSNLVIVGIIGIVVTVPVPA